jgi:hypothetical protein
LEKCWTRIRIKSMQILNPGFIPDSSLYCFFQARSETEEKVHEAVEAAMSASGSAAAAMSASGSVAATATTPASAKPELKRASAAAGANGGPVQKKAKGLWLGAGLDDLDDEDTDVSDSDDEGGEVSDLPSKAVVAQ